MDPFYEHPYSKPFYHPSSPRKWGKAAKEVCNRLIVRMRLVGSQEYATKY